MKHCPACNLTLKLTVIVLGGVIAVQAIAGRSIAVVAQTRRINFNRDIRPILSDKCFACHGPDAVSKKIKLRLDSESAATADLGRGRRAIVPGKIEQSELVKRITAPDELMRMPPVNSGHQLTAQEIESLVEWIKQGAGWQAHWSFIAPVRPSPPEVKNRAWPRNAIDYFVLARLEREGLEPSPQADRATLIRRVSFDLTGLPPTTEEVDQFLNDKSPRAYEKVVDRLLDSPRYGERMAFRWLDAARYADTNGYQIDGDRQMWRWRDWVIEAFNRNLPYDQFMIEQLAGDLLPKATLDQKIATAFNRNHRINAEGGIVPEEYAVEYVVDRVDTTSTVLMGLTMGCARCHNHKYDPLTQKEYYQLFAYFNSIPEDGRAFDQGNSAPWIAAPTRDQQRELDRLAAEINRTGRQIQLQSERLKQRQRLWEKAQSNFNRQWFPGDGLLVHLAMDRSADPVFNKSDRPHHNPPEKKADDKNYKPDAIGFKDGTPVYTAAPTGEGTVYDGKLWFDAGRRADFRYKSTSIDYQERFAISVWIRPQTEQSGAIVTKMPDRAEERDGNLPRIGGWGLFHANGKIVFNMVREWNYDGFRAETESTLALNQWHHVLLVFDGLRQSDDRVQIYLNGQAQRLKVHQPNFYLYWGLPDQPLRVGGGGGAEMRFKGAIDELRIYSQAPEPDQIAVLACADPIDKIAATPVTQRTRGQRLKLLYAYYEIGAPDEIRKNWLGLKSLKNEKRRLEDSLTTVMVMQETPAPRPAFLLRRGAYDAPAGKVERGVPSVLPSMPAGLPDNRLGLAKWMVSPEHPLTARVAVNRLWQMLFGTGLVKTSEDFGSQGDPPSHPELLDWLAVEFMTSTGWDIKAMLKTMVTSATYRQSSKIDPELQQRDPDNRLLARGPRLRLSAEMIRDQALSVSGLLVEKLGGPSVKPYQPEGLYQDMAFSGLTGYERDKGEGLWRRSLYTFWKRTVLSPNMQIFDASARDFCTVRETRTNTPLQSLNLMNDVTYIEAARFLAERMITEGGRTPEGRLAWAFRMVISRRPNDRELQVLLRNFDSQLAHFSHDPKAAERLLSVGQKRNHERIDRIELAAYATTASLILNLDEAITRQ